jgi:hypothetical protein
MEDRLLRAALAGSATGLWVLANDVLWFNVLHFAKGSWLYQLSFLILGHPMRSVPDMLLGVLAHLIFGGILGALFARFVVPHPGQGDYTLRGAAFGVFVWFATLALGTIFRIPTLHLVFWSTALTQLFSAATWGLLFGWLFRRWESETAETGS